MKKSKTDPIVTSSVSDGAARKKLMREECNWQHIGNVDWDDLDFYLANCRSKKDKDSFDTAIRILEALRKQILGQP